MIANTLYYRYFFSYYILNILVEVDAEEKEVVYSYNTIGLLEYTFYSVIDSRQSFIVPLLDNLIDKKINDREIYIGHRGNYRDYEIYILDY